MHDDPERCALAQPRLDVAASANGAGTSRLAHHASAHDESHVRHEEVRCDEDMHPLMSPCNTTPLKPE